jgi:hypothetical protein
MDALWKKGDVVTIYIISPHRGLTIEGDAVVVKQLDRTMDHYMVRFYRRNGSLEREAYERFIDRDGQEGEPQVYIKKFNERIGFSA